MIVDRNRVFASFAKISNEEEDEEEGVLCNAIRVGGLLTRPSPAIELLTFLFVRIHDAVYLFCLLPHHHVALTNTQ